MHIEFHIIFLIFSKTILYLSFLSLSSAFKNLFIFTLPASYIFISLNQISKKLLIRIPLIILIFLIFTYIKILSISFKSWTLNKNYLKWYPYSLVSILPFLKNIFCKFAKDTPIIWCNIPNISVPDITTNPFKNTIHQNNYSLKNRWLLFI